MNIFEQENKNVKWSFPAKWSFSDSWAGFWGVTNILKGVNNTEWPMFLSSPQVSLNNKLSVCFWKVSMLFSSYVKQFFKVSIIVASFIVTFISAWN